MKFQLQITTRDVPHSEALENHIRKKAEKLETFYSNIIGCRVVIEVPHKHKHQGRAFDVRLDIT
ncbi:MAG: HPF/RaiA family ribosome-associated protein, partial [Nitrosospira sp.]